MGDNRRVTTRRIKPGGSVGARRGEVVICLAAGDRLEEFVEGLRCALDHSAADVTVLVYGGGVRTLSVLDRMPSSERLAYIERDALSDAAAAAAPADVVALAPGCLVGRGWLEGLRGAAGADASLASASALGADRVFSDTADLSVEWLDLAATDVAAHAVRNRPRLPAPDGACVYLRRSALDLVGAHDLLSLDGFGRRCVARGLSHVLADDVLVLSQDTTSGREDARSPSGPLARAVGAARRAVRSMTVLIDARALSGPRDGTRLHVLKLTEAVAGTGEVSLSVLVTAGVDPSTRAMLEALPRVNVLIAGDGQTRQPRADVAHRPHQVSSPADLAVLARLGERLIITHQDLISFHHPDYFPSATASAGYRHLTRRALAVADRVLFFSEHVRVDALAEELVEPARAEVVHIGVDHAVVDPAPVPVPPRGAETLEDQDELILCLGSDFAHKNRLFALEVVRELQERHDWPGRLVLAGPHVRYGSSREDEQRLLEGSPRLAGAVVSLDEVTEAGKAWLMARTRLVLYPTVHEGFGLIPFEAADAGVPCLWAAGTALGELLPEDAAGVVTWDAAATADAALSLMRDATAAAANVAAVQAAADALRWEVTAAGGGLPRGGAVAARAGRRARARSWGDARGPERGRHPARGS